jgi:MarR family transcriptional regulator, lower aerobic nicotinate degradation pathway regulator
MSQAGKSRRELPVVPESLANSIGYLLNFNGHLIRERLERVLSPLKLSLRELGVLRIIDSEGPLSQQMLGRRHNIDRTTTVQVIDQLEARQLVVRSQNVEDRRSNLLFLTPRGRKTLYRAVKLVGKEQDSFLSPLAEEERKALFSLLLRLLSSHLSESRQGAVSAGAEAAAALLPDSDIQGLLVENPADAGD